MEEMRSFKDRKDESGLLTWEVLRLEEIKEIARARSNSDRDKFAATVDAMDIITNGEKDDEFYFEMDKIAGEHKNAFNGDLEPSDEEVFDYRRDHALLLVNLASRIDRGEISVVETVSDSRIFNEIAEQVRKGIGQNIYFTGKPGSGKSWSCLRAYEILSNMLQVKVDYRYLFSFNNIDFLDAIDDIKKIPKGGVVILEEAGVNINSKASMSTINRIMSTIFQTVRERGIVCIMNAPDLGFLDKDVRKLLHFWFETERLLINLGECWIKPHVVEVNQREGHIYYPYPRFGSNIKVQRVKFTAPSKELTEIYEKRASAYKAELRSEARLAAREMNENHDPDWVKFKELLDSGVTRTKAMQQMKISAHMATKYHKKYRLMVEVAREN